MKWADRRTLLLEICGDISDADVIAGDKELAPLIEILKKADGSEYTTDEILKIAKCNMAETNDLLKSIPARIDEAEKAKPDTSDIFEKAFEREIESFEKDIEGLNLKRKN